MTASALPEIILTPAEEDTPETSSHTKHDFSDCDGRVGGGSLRRRLNLTPDINNLGLENVYDAGYGGGLGRGIVFPCIMRSFVCE